MLWGVLPGSPHPSSYTRGVTCRELQQRRSLHMNKPRCSLLSITLTACTHPWPPPISLCQHVCAWTNIASPSPPAWVCTCTLLCQCCCHEHTPRHSPRHTANALEHCWAQSPLAQPPQMPCPCPNTTAGPKLGVNKGLAPTLSSHHHLHECAQSAHSPAPTSTPPPC